MQRTLISYLAATIGAAIGFLYGEINDMFYALIALVILDYLTGVMVAVYKHKVSSKVGFKGIMKKFCIFVLVSVAHLIDTHITHTGNVFMCLTMFFYSANECISILENAEKLGLPVPEKLKNILEQVKSENDKGDPKPPATK